ncbi:MAG: hypothetical protein QXL15_01780 [Candidatus Korarchaeota archaeon]
MIRLLCCVNAGVSGMFWQEHPGGGIVASLSPVVMWGAIFREAIITQHGRYGYWFWEILLLSISKHNPHNSRKRTTYYPSHHIRGSELRSLR